MGEARGNGRRDGEKARLPLAKDGPPGLQSPPGGGDGMDSQRLEEELAHILARCALRRAGLLGAK